MTELQKKLAKLSACKEAIDWVADQSLGTAWEKCERPGWLLWLAHKAMIDTKLIVKCACMCARTSLKYVENGEDRPRMAIETAERWIEGNATIRECRDAADAAYSAACAANSADADYSAAYSAACAVYAADFANSADSADSADSAAYFAVCAACAACATDATASTRANLQLCHLIRSVITAEMISDKLVVI